jgi:hypothetical protein
MMRKADRPLSNEEISRMAPYPELTLVRHTTSQLRKLDILEAAEGDFYNTQGKRMSQRWKIRQ